MNYAHDFAKALLFAAFAMAVCGWLQLGGKDR